MSAASPARAAPEPDLPARYEANTPRYTSYPTAVQFTPAVDSATYSAWLAELPADEAVSLYAHVPFCTRLCWYCGCNTRVVNRPAPVDTYAELLLEEIGRVADRLPGRLPAQTLHFGGGTPNTLSIEAFAGIVETLKTRFAFAADAEIAIELDPANLTREWIMAAGRQGLSRASLGVQTLSPEVQAAVNRRETYDDIAACVGWLREAGVASINLDLMYGLPLQTTADVLDTLDQVLRLAPERLALFGYAHVPWMKAHQQLIDTAALPGPSARLEQSETAAERLQAAGYVRIGLDHYALPHDELAQAQAEGRLRRNFQGYTTDAARTLLGFGASAIGRLPQGYVQNVAAELGWRTALAKGELPVARGVAFSADDRFRGELIERLMCDYSVDLAAVRARHAMASGALLTAMRRLQPFFEDGLVRLEGDRLVVETAGRRLVRAVCQAFDAYDAQPGRHSSTV